MPTKFSKIRQMVNLLEKHPEGISSHKLAGHLKIDERTIRRYLTELRESGYAVSDLRTGANKPSLYTLTDPRKPPKHLHTGLKKIKEDMRKWGNPKYLGILDQVTDYFRSMDSYEKFKGYLKDEQRDVHDTIYHIDHGPFSQEQVNSGMLSKLENAINGKKVLKLNYSSYSGEKNEFDFFPYVLSLRVGTLYLIGRKHENKGMFLSLSVKRIKRCAALSQTFTPSPFDPEEYYRYCFGQYPRQPYERPANVLLRVHENWVQKYLSESHFNPPGKLIREKGKVFFELDVMIKPDFVNWVMSLYPYVKPEKPGRLVKMVRDRCQG